MVARELMKRLARAERDGHEHEHARHGHDEFERLNEENVLGTDATSLWRAAWDGYDGGRFERGGKDIERNDCVCDDAPYHSGSFQGSLLWIFLHVNLLMVIVAVFYLCMHQVKITRRCRRWATST